MLAEVLCIPVWDLLAVGDRLCGNRVEVTTMVRGSLKLQREMAGAKAERVVIERVEDRFYGALRLRQRRTSQETCGFCGTDCSCAHKPEAYW
jgi:hypothetical protein